MAPIEGKYQLESRDNFDAFLKAQGVSFFLRSLAKTLKPTVEITRCGEEYQLRTVTTFKTTDLRFKLGEEFQETRMDDVKCKSVFQLESDNRLVQTQRPDNGLEVSYIREFTDTHLNMLCTAGDVKLTCIYKRIV